MEELNYELLAAAYNGDIKSVEDCVAKGANVNCKGYAGWTPLHYAAKYGHTEIVARLISLGSVIDKDVHGRTPYGWARNEQIRQLIQSQGKGVHDVSTDAFLPKDQSTMLNRLLGEGSYESYDTRVMVTGQFGVGKTSLLMILVGDNVPERRQTTDGISLLEGRCGLSIEGKEWILIDKDDYNALDVVYNKVLMSSEEDKSNIKYNQCVTIAVHDHQEHVVIPKEKGQSKPSLYHQQRCRVIAKMTKKEIRKKMEMLLKSGKYMMKIGRLIFWDFGGQYVYYTTHKTFMTFRALFLVVFDGSVPLNKEVKDVICFPGQYGIPTAAVFFQHWVNSILTYCEPKHLGIPKILFVATHKDKVPGEALEETRITLYNEIEELFRDHDGRNHLIIEHQLFVNATDKNDPEIKTLKQIITDLTFRHPCWGEKMPNMWVPLELEIAELTAEGKQILSLEEIKELNQASEVSVLSEEDLKFFLQVQHSLGKIVYFDAPQLRKFIIINPLFMIEVMKSFVTDDQFWPKDFKMRQPFTQMSMEGVIQKRDLFKVWEQPTFSHIFLHKEFVFDMLVHLDILSEQRHYDKETGNRLEIEEYFVPCMLTRRNTTNYMEFECTPSRAIGFAFVFKGTIVPPALPNRLISACLSMWYVKRYKGQTLLFSGFVVLSWNKSHDIVVCVERNSILVYIVHKSLKGLIVSDIATEVRECLYNNLQRISEFYQSTVSRETSDKKLPFHLELACSDFTCYTPATAVLADEERLCAKHGNRVEVDVWYQMKPLEHCEGKCEGLSKDALDKTPSDSEILRLSTLFGSDMVRRIERRPTDIPEEHFDSVPTDEILDAMAPVIGRKSFQLGIELGQSVQDLEAIQHDYSNDLKAQTRQILYNWRNDRSVKATLSILQQALVNVERGTQCLKSIVDELGVTKHNFREQTKEKPAPTNLEKQIHISSDLFKKKTETRISIPRN